MMTDTRPQELYSKNTIWNTLRLLIDNRLDMPYHFRGNRNIIEAQWRCGAVAQWRSGAVALWRCGAMARASGSQTREPGFESCAAAWNFVHSTLLQFTQFNGWVVASR